MNANNDDAARILNGVRDNLLKPMHDSIATRSDRLCRLVLILLVMSSLQIMAIGWLAYRQNEIIASTQDIKSGRP